jgi:hypothetical protein
MRMKEIVEAMEEVVHLTLCKIVEEEVAASLVE